MTKSIYDQLNASGTVAKQRVVETFSGDALDTDRWNENESNGTNTFGMADSVDGGYTMTADLNWHSYKIECDSTYKFSIDGVLEYTSPTTNLPTGAMAPISGIQGSSSATAPSYSIKYVECYNT